MQEKFMSVNFRLIRYPAFEHWARPRIVIYPMRTIKLRFT